MNTFIYIIVLAPTLLIRELINLDSAYIIIKDKLIKITYY